MPHRQKQIWVMAVQMFKDQTASDGDVWYEQWEAAMRCSNTPSNGHIEKDSQA